MRAKFRDDDQAGLDDLVTDFIDEAEDKLVGVYDLVGKERSKAMGRSAGPTLKSVSLIGAKAGCEPHLDQDARAWVQVCKWRQQLSFLRPRAGDAMTAGRKVQAEFLERRLRTSGHRQKLGVAEWEEWLCRRQILASSDFDEALASIEELTEARRKQCEANTRQRVGKWSNDAMSGGAAGGHQYTKC